MLVLGLCGKYDEFVQDIWTKDKYNTVFCHIVGGILFRRNDNEMSNLLFDQWTGLIGDQNKNTKHRLAALFGLASLAGSEVCVEQKYHFMKNVDGNLPARSELIFNKILQFLTEYIKKQTVESMNADVVARLTPIMLSHVYVSSQYFNLAEEFLSENNNTVVYTRDQGFSVIPKSRFSYHLLDMLSTMDEENAADRSAIEILLNSMLGNRFPSSVKLPIVLKKFLGKYKNVVVAILKEHGDLYTEFLVNEGLMSLSEATAR